MQRTALGFVAGLLTGASLVYLGMSARPRVPDRVVMRAVDGDTTGSPAPMRDLLPLLGNSTSTEDFRALAESDPFGALERIVAIDDQRARSLALFTATPVWVARDPAGILDAIQQLDDPTDGLDRRTRDTLFQSVFSSWTVRDTESALRYLAGLDGSKLPSGSGSGTVAFVLPVAIDPGADLVTLFALSEQLPAPYVRTIRLQVVRQMAERDLALALDYLNRLPVGDRRQAAPAIAAAYVARDADAAIEWAQTTGMPDAIEAVLRALANTDPVRAIELAVATPGGAAAANVVFGSISATRADREQIGNMLLELPPSGQKDRALDAMIRAWSQQDSAALLEWLVARSDSVPRELFGRAAAGLYNDPELGLSYVDRVPVEARADWISALAGYYASSDPRAALTWVQTLQAEPGYGAAVAKVAQTVAARDGRAAAQLIDSSGMQTDRNAVSTVASAWAGYDPMAAAEWVRTVPDGDARLAGLQRVLGAWTGYDRRAAESWLLRLPRGAERDAVLATLMGSIRNPDDVPNDALFDAFSSTSAREEPILIMSMRIAADDPARARSLVERYVSDPNRLQRFEMSLKPPDPATRLCGGAFRPVRC
jgi:hypothetical protein